jgi:membrane protein implicated in regulation of membrane protease activity
VAAGLTLLSGAGQSPSPRRKATPTHDVVQGSGVAVLAAILLAIFVLPPHWGLVAILVGLTIELGEAGFWIHLSRRRRAVTGAEGLIGATARVVEPCRPWGRVRVHGELWQAHCALGADAGQTVHIQRVDGLVLHVEPQ